MSSFVGFPGRLGHPSLRYLGLFRLVQLQLTLRAALSTTCHRYVLKQRDFARLFLGRHPHWSLLLASRNLCIRRHLHLLHTQAPASRCPELGLPALGSSTLRALSFWRSSALHAAIVSDNESHSHVHGTIAHEVQSAREGDSRVIIIVKTVTLENTSIKLFKLNKSQVMPYSPG